MVPNEVSVPIVSVTAVIPLRCRFKSASSHSLPCPLSRTAIRTRCRSSPER